MKLNSWFVWKLWLNLLSFLRFFLCFYAFYSLSAFTNKYPIKVLLLLTESRLFSEGKVMKRPTRSLALFSFQNNCEPDPG